METPKILIGIPTMGEIHTNLVVNLLRWTKKFNEATISYYFTFKVQPVDRARNQITDYFLNTKFKDGTRFTHLFFIDADTIPPKDALEKLLALDRDITTGLTPMLHLDKVSNVWGTFYNAFSPVKDAAGVTIKTQCPKENTGIVEVERCGGSCLLIRREVFEKMKTPYFRFILRESGLDHVKSEDIYFCDTARELGFQIWADTSIVCQHSKNVMLGS